MAVIWPLGPGRSPLQDVRRDCSSRSPCCELYIAPGRAGPVSRAIYPKDPSLLWGTGGIASNPFMLSMMISVYVSNKFKLISSSTDTQADPASARRQLRVRWRLPPRGRSRRRRIQERNQTATRFHQNRTRRPPIQAAPQGAGGIMVGGLQDQADGSMQWG